MAKRRIWNKEEVIREIRSLNDRGISLDMTTIKRVSPCLKYASKKYFGSYPNALKEAGFDYSKINRRILSGEKKWTNASILSAIREYYQENETLEFLVYNEESLYRASVKHFGSFKKGVLLAGLDYFDSMGRRRWSKKKVIETIQGLIVSNGDSRTISKDSGLYGACVSYFGDVEHAVRAAGFDYDDVRITKDWDKEKILKEIQKLSKQPDRLYHLRYRRSDLDNAIRRHFGGYEDAIRASGLNPDDLLLTKRWNKERIIRELRDYVDEWGSIDFLQRRIPSLDHAVHRYFGTMEEATNAAGLDFDKVRTLRKNWTNEKILKTIRKLHEYGEDLSYANMELNYSPLIQAASGKTHFGTWENAVRQAGFDYDEICRNWNIENFRGIQFERCLKEVFEIIGWKLVYQKRFKFEDVTCIPDFYDPFNGAWIDAKLTANTKLVHQAIVDYTLHNEDLTIVYLQGTPRSKDLELADFVSVRSYYDLLREKHADELIRKIESLRRKMLPPEFQSALSKYLKRVT